MLYWEHKNQNNSFISHDKKKYLIYWNLMKKIFTTLIAGSLIVTTGIEVKANTSNSALKSTSSCDASSTENNYQLISMGGAPHIYTELADCYQLQNDAIDTNVLDIDSNTSDITSNTSGISSNSSSISTINSAIQTLQGSSSNSSDITANTNKINSNTSNINKIGEGVAGSTALTAALSALPQLSQDSKTTCGVGTGAYSSRYAVGFGCASKVSERAAINAGGSYVFGGSKNYGGGTLDNAVVKAGFVFKLGELKKPTQISFKDKNIIDNKISSLEKNNDELKAKNDQLLARLENLEKLTLALKLNPDKKVISLAK